MRLSLTPLYKGKARCAMANCCRPSGCGQGHSRDEGLEGCDSLTEGTHALPHTRDITQPFSGFQDHILLTKFSFNIHTACVCDISRGDLSHFVDMIKRLNMHRQ